MKLPEIKWNAFLRKNGSKGIRNKVLVIYTVECASFVAKEIVNRIADTEVEVVGFSGCTDNAYAVHLMISLLRHPNVGATLVVGLGGEYVQPEWLSDIAAEEGQGTAWFNIQNIGGTGKSIDYGIFLVKKMQEKLADTPLVSMGFEDFVIGAECGGSDYTSGLVGNVVVGHLYDKLVEAGGIAIFEEIVETVGLVDLLAGRAANERAKKEICYTYEKALEYCKSVRQYSVSPGNFAGGLSTIEEKSMGAVIKSGSMLIQGVLKVGNPSPKTGLWLLDSPPNPYWMQFGITNPNDNEGLIDLISCGAHLVFLVTGRGNVVGSAVAPVIKITGNSDTYSRMEEDMGFDAGRVLEGKCSQEELTIELAELVASVGSGNRTKSEEWGHKEYFIPYKYQEKRAAFKRCATL